MTMAISPHHLTVGQLFQQNFIFRVPKYQRYYAWDDDQIDDFLKDLGSCVAARRAGGRKHHFLGGIVTVTTMATGTVRRNVEVIDGQQRLATLTILAHELSAAMKTLATQVDETAANSPKAFLETSAASLWRQYESYQDAVALNMVEVARLELSKPDEAFFAQMLDEASAAPVPTRTSHERLARAKERIRSKLASWVHGGSDIERAATLSFIADVLGSDWSVIHMGADQRDEAYMLFQVLNDRGTSLTEGELLRSRTLEMLDAGGTPQQSQMVEEAWDKILVGRPDDIGEGLRWIYASYEAKRPGKTTLYDDFLASRYPNHSAGQLTGPQATAVVAATQSIKADFDRTADILEGRWPYQTAAAQVTTWDKDRLRLLIPELKLVITMPLLIATSALDQQVFARVVHLVERFMYRYKIVVNARVEPASKVFLKHAKIARDTPSAFDVATLKTDLAALISSHAPEALFRARLFEQRYTTTSTTKPIKYLLLTLDAYMPWYRAGGSGPATPTKTTVADFAHNTLEHVHAQNAVPADPAMTTLVNDLGNLAVLSQADNAAAGNQPFPAKRAILAASLSPLNRDIGAQQAWSIAEVAARQGLLTDLAVSVFAI
jgi:hypothetical protein